MTGYQGLYLPTDNISYHKNFWCQQSLWPNFFLNVHHNVPLKCNRGLMPNHFRALGILCILNGFESSENFMINSLTFMDYSHSLHVDYIITNMIELIGKLHMSLLLIWYLMMCNHICCSAVMLYHGNIHHHGIHNRHPVTRLWEQIL